jgi:hypothetical protein
MTPVDICVSNLRLASKASASRYQHGKEHCMLLTYKLMSLRNIYIYIYIYQLLVFESTGMSISPGGVAMWHNASKTPWPGLGGLSESTTIGGVPIH